MPSAGQQRRSDSGSAGPSTGLETANEEVVEAGIVAEGVFDFVEVDVVALDKWADLTPSPSALLPPAVEAGEKRPVEDGAKDEMPRARAVEPAEERLSRNVLDDDRPGLAVAVAGWWGGECARWEGMGKEREWVGKMCKRRSETRFVDASLCSLCPRWNITVQLFSVIQLLYLK